MKAFNHLSSCLMAIALLGFASVASCAEDRFPSRPIRLVVPWPAGGTVDIVGRFLAERMTERLKTTVVVENKPGATGQIGSQVVANAAPDGYTLLIMSATVHTVSPNLAKSFPFDPVESFPTGRLALAAARSLSASFVPRRPARSCFTCPTRARGPRSLI